MARAANYLAWQSRLILPELGHRVVEVGCGVGNFTNKLLDRELVLTTDVEPACIERLCQRYADQPQLHAFVAEPVSEAFAGLARFRPDSCVCTNVLEHIQDDRAALHAMAAILQPHGRIVLWVPAFQALFGPLDRQLQHFRRYRRRDMTRLAEATGLRIIKTHYVNAVGFGLWWASTHLLRQQSLTGIQIAIFDRLVVPWLSALETMAPPPFGQSLFAVLEKR